MTTTSTELALRAGEDLDTLARLGKWLALAESGQNTPDARGAAAALRLYYAQALELPPLAALELSVIEGKLKPSSQLLRALADRAGYRIVRVESSETTCTAAIVDKETGEELGRSTFTIEDARRAGLIKERGGYQKHPGRMLWARASAFAVRDFAPTVALGMVLADEDEEILESRRPRGPASTYLPPDENVVEGEADEVDESDLPDALVGDEPEARDEWSGDAGVETFGEPVDDLPDVTLEGPSVPPPAPSSREGRAATQPQLAKANALLSELANLEAELGDEPSDWRAWAHRTAGVASLTELTRERASFLIDRADEELAVFRGRLDELDRGAP